MNKLFHVCLDRHLPQLLLLMVFVVTGLVGCASPGKKVLDADMAGLKEQIWDLKKQNSELGLKVSYIESDVSLLKEQLKAKSSEPAGKTGIEPDTIVITSGPTDKKLPVPGKKMVADKQERIVPSQKKTPPETLLPPIPTATTAEPMESTITEDRGIKTEEVVIDSASVAPAKPEPVADSEKMYKAALTDFNAGEYDVAVSKFDSLIRLFPGIGLAAHSQYWIGESYYVRKKFKKAIEEYRKVFLRWPKSPRVPEALLKTGLSWIGLKKIDKGQEVLKRLIEEYPNHFAADTARRRLEK